MSGTEEPELELRSGVPAWAGGLLLPDYLARRFPYHDRATWLRLIADDRVRCTRGDQTVRGPLRPGDSVAYRRVHREPEVPTDIVVLHRDEDLVAAVKPAHLPSHADGVFVTRTFVHLLGRLLAPTAIDLAHRLDRETSGVMLVACHKQARAALETQFRSGTVEKSYLAVVHGLPTADRFTIEQPIGRARDSAISLRRAVRPDGDADAQAARTDFTVLARLAGHALLRAHPRTGRTHQIRVHLHHAGHPLVGDKLYGRSDDEYLAWVRHVKAGGDPAWAEGLTTGRHLLHAEAVTVQHPRHGRRMTFRAPIPADMREFLASRGWDQTLPDC